MFDSLTKGLGSAFRSLQGRGKLSESNMRDGLKMVRTALLEADVSISVVRDFMERVTAEAIGEKVLKAINPSQQVIAIVNQALIDLMGPVDHSLHLKPDLTILMLCGLQGSGKTTTCGKLARTLKENGRKPMLVGADLQRPAAIRQLQVLGEKVGVPVHADFEASDPVAVCNHAVKQAKKLDVDVVILDTAGRLHVDEELMQQLSRIESRVQPEQVYLVVDAMTGQDAVNSAKVFNESLELDGVIMTKLDGDARGGAALSVKQVTGVPIKFMGVGEHLDALEEFHPDRMASRILGMGDIVSLVEQAQQKLDQEEMARQQAQLEKGEFTLDDFRSMIMQATRMGPMSKVMSLIPGMGAMKDAISDVDSAKDIKRMCGIIDSMTVEERRNPKTVIDTSRRRRIADGAGVQPHQVSELVKMFGPIADTMKRMSSMSMRERMKAMKDLQGQMTDPRGPKKQKGGSGKRLTSKERAKLKKQREKELRKKKRAKKGKGS